jgi:hypothetical protein
MISFLLELLLLLSTFTFYIFAFLYSFVFFYFEFFNPILFHFLSAFYFGFLCRACFCWFYVFLFVFLIYFIFKEEWFIICCRSSSRGILIEDIKFHQCVRLPKFDKDRSITFIPPDGIFELMTYRITDNINLPFKVMPLVQEFGKNRVEANIKVNLNFEYLIFSCRSNLFLRETLLLRMLCVK